MLVVATPTTGGEAQHKREKVGVETTSRTKQYGTYNNTTVYAVQKLCNQECTQNSLYDFITPVEEIERAG